MSKKRFETLAIRTNFGASGNRENSSPIFLNSGYQFHDSEHSRLLFNEEVPGFVYARYGNPTTEELNQKMCALEDMDFSFVTTTGMSAIFLSLIAFLESGDHVLASRSLFGSSHQLLTQLLPRFQIQYTYVDADQPETWEAAIRKETKMIFLETPSNPGLAIIDLGWVVSLAQKYGLKVNVDNSFATPYIQKPGDFGVDIITHSVTKHLDGQGRVLGGVLLCRNADKEKVQFAARHTGPMMSPFNAWVISKSLETLALRMDRHSANALKVAQYLAQHSAVDWVKYPYLSTHPQFAIAKKQMSAGGGLVTFALKGGMQRAKKFMDSLKMITLTANLGDTRTLATHPALTTHSRLSPEDRQKVQITDDLIRFSIGLEHIDDIIADIEQAIVQST